MVVVSSAKGGVGKSVIAANLAAGLVRFHGARTVLVDANLEAGDQAVLFNVKQTRGLGLLAGLSQIDSSVARELLLPAPGGLSLVTCPADPVIAADVAAEAVRAAAEVYRDEFDYTIVDTHGGLDEVNLELFEATDRILLIATPEMNTARHTAQFLNIARTLGYEHKVDLVLNRADAGLAVEALSECIGRVITCRIVSAGPVFVQSANRAQLLFERDPSAKLPITRNLRSLVAWVAGEALPKSVDRAERADRKEPSALTPQSTRTEPEPGKIAAPPPPPSARGSKVAGFAKASLAGVGVAAALTVGVIGGAGVFGAQLPPPEASVPTPVSLPLAQAPVSVTFEAMAVGPEPGPTRTAVVPVVISTVSTPTAIQPTAVPPEPTPLAHIAPVELQPTEPAIAVVEPDVEDTIAIDAPAEAPVVETTATLVQVSPEPAAEPDSESSSPMSEDPAVAVTTPEEEPIAAVIGEGWTEGAGPLIEGPPFAETQSDDSIVVLRVAGHAVISMHAAPSLSAATLRLLPAGTEAKLLGVSALGNNLPWQQVQVGNDVGWVLQAAVQRVPS
jgi:MinD-like ATPase involved in chromosome partitioning or flagellar assembly